MSYCKNHTSVFTSYKPWVLHSLKTPKAATPDMSGGEIPIFQSSKSIEQIHLSSCSALSVFVQRNLQ